MEDEILAMSLVDGEDVQLFAVFDGHGGRKAGDAGRWRASAQDQERISADTSTYENCELQIGEGSRRAACRVSKGLWTDSREPRRRESQHGRQR